MRISKVFTLFFLSIQTGQLWAEANAASDKLIPTTGRAIFSAAGTGGHNTIGLLGADIMQPLYGNENGFLFGDFASDGATDSTFLVSPGLGVRQIYKNQVLGAYFFGDYEKVSLGENFWVLSPGIEWMSPHWDAHLNGYLPTQTTQQNGAPIFSDAFGNYSDIAYVTGTHNQYNTTVSPYDVIGNGIDAEMGYSFSAKDNLRSHVFIGGYYYQAPNDNFIYSDVENILGITGGFEQPISKNFSLRLSNSYDQVSLYTVGVTLKLTFGGESNLYSNDVHTRLLDSVERHVGVIGTGAGTYDQQAYETGPMALQYDNIYFLSADGTGDGTYGNPASLNQTELDAIDAESPNDSRIYLQGDSTYTIDETTTTDTTSLVVYSGQDFYGRTSDYTAPATTSDQPQIVVDTLNGYNGFTINDTDNSFSDLTIYGNDSTFTSYTTAFAISDNSSVDFNSMNISSFKYGIHAINADNNATTTVNVENSTFDNTGSGIRAENNSNGTLLLNVSDSVFEGGDVGGNGIELVNNVFGGTTGTLTLNANNIQGNNYTNGGVSGTNWADGLLSVNIQHSTFTNNAQVGVGLENNSEMHGSGEGNVMAIIDSTVAEANGIPNSSANISVVNTSTGITNASITNSVISNGSPSASGLFVSNGGTGSQSVMNINDLSGTTISNNGVYGIWGIANSGTTTVINYSGVTFLDNTPTNISAAPGDNITWIPTL